MKSGESRTLRRTVVSAFRPTDRGAGDEAMKHLRWTWMAVPTCLCVAGAAGAQTENGEWRSQSGDAGSTKYAPLDQINRANVKNLRIAGGPPAGAPLML